jgi:hypothetical protein
MSGNLPQIRIAHGPRHFQVSSPRRGSKHHAQETAGIVLYLGFIAAAMMATLQAAATVLCSASMLERGALRCKEGCIEIWVRPSTKPQGRLQSSNLCSSISLWVNFALHKPCGGMNKNSKKKKTARYQSPVEIPVEFTAAATKIPKSWQASQGICA